MRKDYSELMRSQWIMAGWLVLGIGCGKQPSSSAPAPKPASQVQPLAPPAVDAAQVSAMLSELTQAVRKFGAEQRRVPKTLEEVAAGGYLTRIPAAPSGKKFAIDKNLQVYLANP